MLGKILGRLFGRHKLRGQVATAMLFIIAFIILMVMFILAAPIATRMSSEITKQGVSLLTESNEVFSQIGDQEVSQTLVEATTSAKDTMIETSFIGIVLSKYGWVLVLVIVAIVMFLRSRMIVERESRGLV